MKICLISGSLASADSPRISGQVGTLRRCINVNPSFSISSMIILKIAPWSFSSFGRKRRPVPYFPFSGTGIPCKRINSCGICSRMPAPSPVLLSAPSAPRWRMFSNTFNADSTSSCDLPPWMFTNIPTPQASCSFSASYKPNCLGCRWYTGCWLSSLPCCPAFLFVSLLKSFSFIFLSLLYSVVIPIITIKMFGKSINLISNWYNNIGFCDLKNVCLLEIYFKLK